MSALVGSRCLVTGASGFLGSYVVDKLVEVGARARCLVRRSSRREFLPADGVEFVQGDVTDVEALRLALADTDVVFHLAGLIKAPRPEDYFRVNYLGTINLLEACRQQARAPRVVLVSSLAASGPSAPGRPKTEESQDAPLTPYGKSKLLAERAAASFGRELPLTIVRPPTIYGPRDRESLLLFRLVAMGVRPRLSVTSEISVIHAADLADGLLLAAANPSAIGRTYFMASDDRPSLDSLIEAIASALGRRGIDLPVPGWAVRGAGRIAELIRDLGGVSLVFDRWKAEEVLSGFWACSNTRAREELGFSPRISLAEGIAGTAQWYQRMRWL